MAMSEVDYLNLGGASNELIVIPKGVATTLKKDDIYIGANWSSSCIKPTSGTYNQLIEYTGCFVCQITAETSITIPTSTGSMYYILRGCGTLS